MWRWVYEEGVEGGEGKNRFGERGEFEFSVMMLFYFMFIIYFCNFILFLYFNLIFWLLRIERMLV